MWKKNILTVMEKLSKIRFKNYDDKTIKIDAITKFNIINSKRQPNINEITLNFSFKDINFNKKKVIPFFMALELITGQKCIITRSKKTVMNLKIRQGAMVGCKVTLRKKNLYKFFDYLLLALPRSENFKGISKKKIKNSNKNMFSFVLEDLFTFYQLELDLHPIVQSLNISIKFNTKNINEKIFLLSSYKLPIY